jgi:GldM N-terminal domain
MMILRGLGCCLVMVLFGCMETAERARDKQDELLDSFKKVDRDMQKSHDNIREQSLVGQIEMMEEDLKNGIVDSSLNPTNNARKKLELFIDQSQTYLADKPEDDQSSTDLYFIQQKKGLELYQLIKEYQTEISKLSLTAKVKRQTDSIMQGLVTIPSGLVWADVYFKGTSIVAAKTMLNKFKLDIQRAFILLKNSK